LDVGIGIKGIGTSSGPRTSAISHGWEVLIGNCGKLHPKLRKLNRHTIHIAIWTCLTTNHSHPRASIWHKWRHWRWIKELEGIVIEPDGGDDQ
jgi:hypothetical protein